MYAILPFPTRETSGCDAIKGKGQNAADDSTEVTEDCHQNDALSQLVGSVPVAELQQYAWPQASFLRASVSVWSSISWIQWHLP